MNTKDTTKSFNLSFNHSNQICYAVVIVLHVHWLIEAVLCCLGYINDSKTVKIGTPTNANIPFLSCFWKYNMKNSFSWQHNGSLQCQLWTAIESRKDLILPQGTTPGEKICFLKVYIQRHFSWSQLPAFVLWMFSLKTKIALKFFSVLLMHLLTYIGVSIRVMIRIIYAKCS